MLNDDNNYKKGDKKMRDFIRLEYEARMKKEQEETEKAVSLFLEFGGVIEKGREIKKPKNQIWGKGFGIKHQAQYMMGPLKNFDGEKDSNATRLADYKMKAV